MHVSKTNIEGVLIFTPKIFGDDRGYFLESFNQKVFNELVKTDKYVFVQDNESKSVKNVLRGLHFQNPPFDQGKLVRVIQGGVLDVVVDIRKNSPTYGQYFSMELDGEKKQMLWIPPGMAHGFVSKEDNTVFAYKCTSFYKPESEGCISWDDTDLKIDWKINDPVISEKDQEGVSFIKFNSPF